jgi:hypothetical protein
MKYTSHLISLGYLGISVLCPLETQKLVKKRRKRKRKRRRKRRKILPLT